jgi:hypothetical protein
MCKGHERSQVMRGSIVSHDLSQTFAYLVLLSKLMNYN